MSMDDDKLNILSWGAGLQSTCLLAMAVEDELPLDVAIFADTGYENSYTYEVVKEWSERAAMAGIKVVVIGSQDIFRDQLSNVSLPLFVEGSGGRQIRRRCTRDYKIRPIQRVIRGLIGLKSRGRPTKKSAWSVRLAMGITVDEIERAKPSRVSYIEHIFPLLDLGMTREDCVTWFEERDLEAPRKSGCIFCPYQPANSWEKMDGQKRSEIIWLEDQINERGLVKIRDQTKKVSFRPSKKSAISPLQADFLNICDGGYCGL